MVVQQIEFEHRRYHARGAVGGRGDDASAGSVLFVHRYGEDVEPVVVRKGNIVLPQPVAQLGRTPLIVQSAGDDYRRLAVCSRLDCTARIAREKVRVLC